MAGECLFMEQEKIQHEIKISAGARLSVSGVCDVLGFDDTSIVAKTVMGVLNIDGRDLHISRLDVDAGVLEAEGSVTGVWYDEPKPEKHGFFRGVFR